MLNVNLSMCAWRSAPTFKNASPNLAWRESGFSRAVGIVAQQADVAFELLA
jgi:hypothetical protein